MANWVKGINNKQGANWNGVGLSDKVVIEGGVSIDSRAVVNYADINADTGGTTSPPKTADLTRYPFTLNNVSGFSKMEITYSYTVYQNYGSAYIYFNDVLKHSAGTSQTNITATVTYDISTEGIKVRCYAINNSSYTGWHSQARFTLQSVKLLV